MTLPRHIIKKFGVTKKAWRVFRALKKGKFKTLKKLASKVSKTKTRGKKLAKKKKNTSFNLPSGLKKLAAPIGAIMYGAAREKISNAIANTEFAKKLPVSNYTDEGIMLGLNFAARKFLGVNKIPVVRSAFMAGKAIEWARIGEQLSTDFMKKSNSTATTTSSFR